MSTIIDRDPGPSTWTIGQARVTRVEEVTHKLPVEQFLPSATPELWKPLRASLSEDQLDASGQMTIAIAAYAIESRGRRILVDTCIGCEHVHGSPASPLLHRLAAAGLPPDSFDVVLCTHFHFDHIGWNTRFVDGERRPTFERARYVFGADEWSATRDADHHDTLLQSFDNQVRWVVDAGLADLVAPDRAITDEVQLVPTIGHSPGHMSVLIRSDGQEAIITGDAAHHPLQLLVPDMASTADQDPAAATKTRRALIDRALDRHTILIGTHFAAPHAVSLFAADGGLDLRPAS